MKKLIYIGECIAFVVTLFTPSFLIYLTFTPAIENNSFTSLFVMIFAVCNLYRMDKIVKPVKNW
jgi:hypothetical protein